LKPDDPLDALAPWKGAPRWWLGLSGGLDSTCLLHMLARLSDIPPLTAVHVDHGLHPDSARWAAHCRELCTALDVEYLERGVAVGAAGQGPEAAARTARYGAFEELVGAGEVLLLAHHADDQVETFFLRLMRGAGARGLAGIPRDRALGAGHLVRPLLEFPRSELEAYARERQLHWVEDGGNLDQSLDRNFLRNSVLPLLARRWPGYRESVGQSMAAMRDAELDQRRAFQPLLDATTGEVFGEPTLDLYDLGNIDPHSLARLLRLWLRDLGIEPPGRARLREFVRQLRAGGGNAAPRLRVDDYCLQRFQHRIHLYACIDAPEGVWKLTPDRALEVRGMGRVSMHRTQAEGLPLPARGYWEVRLRRGGERCRPRGRRHSRSLKKLMQEYGVPRWWRGRLPLLYAGDELVAVADLWECEGYAAREGEPAYKLRWQPNPMGGDRIPD